MKIYLSGPPAYAEGFDTCIPRSKTPDLLDFLLNKKTHTTRLKKTLTLFKYVV